MQFFMSMVPVFVDAVVMVLICDSRFVRRRKTGVFIITIFAMALFIYGILKVTYGLSQPYWLKALPILLLWLLTILFLYEVNFAHMTFIVAFLYILGLIVEYIVLSVGLRWTGIGMEQFLQDTEYSYQMMFVSKTMLFTIAFMISKLLQRRQKQIKLPLWEWLAVLMISGFTIFDLNLSIMMMEQNNSLLNWLPIQATGLLCMNIAMVLILDNVAIKHHMEKENLALQEKIRYNMKSLQAATDAFDAQRRLTHDFDNRISAIAQLLRLENPEEALSYAQSVLQKSQRSLVAVSTNNPIVDAVLNQKYALAQEQGVQMQFLINDLSAFPMTSDELVTVLSSLLDNALEACAKLEGKRHIKVKVMLEPSVATLSVQNTSLPVQVIKNQITTTKHDKKMHGFGLKNVKQILSQNMFEYAIKYEAGWFHFAAMAPR